MDKPLMGQVARDLSSRIDKEILMPMQHWMLAFETIKVAMVQLEDRRAPRRQAAVGGPSLPPSCSRVGGGPSSSQSPPAPLDPDGDTPPTAPPGLSPRRRLEVDSRRRTEAQLQDKLGKQRSKFDPATGKGQAAFDRAQRKFQHKAAKLATSKVRRFSSPPCRRTRAFDPGFPWGADLSLGDGLAESTRWVCTCD